MFMVFLLRADDMLIKLWDWEKKWTCTQVFEGHTHYVMQIVINPKDNNTFASASLDRTVKVGFCFFISGESIWKTCEFGCTFCLEKKNEE